jgi:hypothetical protein
VYIFIKRNKLGFKNKALKERIKRAEFIIIFDWLYGFICRKSWREHRFYKVQRF